MHSVDISKENVHPAFDIVDVDRRESNVFAMN